MTKPLVRERPGSDGYGSFPAASEMRILAQRVAQAAREIEKLIGASVERVDAGRRARGGAVG